MLLNSDVDYNTDSKINPNSYYYDDKNRGVGVSTYVIAFALCVCLIWNFKYIIYCFEVPQLKMIAKLHQLQKAVVRTRYKQT